VLSGTGTAGAYHAGVLRALREAGVRVDLVAGRGIGAACALFAAVDADARLWDEQGLWSRIERPQRLYRWRTGWRILWAGIGTSFAALSLPLLAALALALAYPLVYLAMVAWPGMAEPAASRYAAAVSWLLSPALLLGWVPRAVTTALLLAFGVFVAALLAGIARSPGRRSAVGATWWHALGAPMDATGVVQWVADGFWRYLRGVAHVVRPPVHELSQRYAELLRENVGQPGYRELVVAAHDLDARADLVFALLEESRRAEYFARPGSDTSRAREVLDLAGPARAHVIDALAGALTVAPLCEAAQIAFAAESPWRGESHRLVDRPGAVQRLLEEVYRAGARQVIVVGADAPAVAPHGLEARRLTPRARMGESVAAQEVAALRDALVGHSTRFQGCFLIRPAHNPIGPLDFAGAFDHRSDRPCLLAELLSRGYEDAHRQFVDPIVGASGEALAASVEPGAGARSPGVA
jgi:hypothetical protein